MNKSIYEEALEAYGHVNAIVQNKKSHLTWEEEVHHLANITRALQHAKKQEKLLDMYREYFRLNSVPKSEWTTLLFNRLLEVQKEIRELENEKI